MPCQRLMWQQISLRDPCAGSSKSPHVVRPDSASCLGWGCRTYNPPEGRGQKAPISQKEAMQELLDTVGTAQAASQSRVDWRVTV